MEPTNPDHHDVDVVLEEIRPRMATEKQRYLRRRFGVIVSLPLLAVGTIAYAANGDPAPVSQVADAPVELPAVDEKSDEKADAAEKADEKADAEKAEAPKEPGSYVDAEKMDDIKSIKDGADAAGDSLDKELAEAMEKAGDAINKAGDDAKTEADAEAKALAEAQAEADAKAKAEAEKAPAPPSDITETASTVVGDAGSVSMTRTGATVSVTVTGTNAGWTATVVSSGGPKAMVSFSAEDGTEWIAMGTIEGDVLTVKTWSEYWPTTKAEKADDGGQKNGNKNKNSNEEKAGK